MIKRWANKFRKTILQRDWLVVIFFVVFFVIALSTLKDYGIAHDEVVQRQHSHFNYYEYLKVLDKLPFFNFGQPALMPRVFFDRYQSVADYENKYYGTAIQMPMVIIEHFFNFQLGTTDMFYTRHVLTLGIFFVALICFYQILNRFVLKNKFYALAGTLFLILSPRIYGQVFFNIKDTVFMSLCVINAYWSLKYLNRHKKTDLLILAFISAITINSRVIGGLIIFLTAIFKLLKNRQKSTTILNVLILAILTWFFYVLITPASWSEPITFVFKNLDYFFFYIDPTSQEEIYNYYFGQNISSRNLPWHYLPVWIFISTPIMYTIFYVMSWGQKIKQFLRSRLDLNLFFLDLIFLLPFFLVMILRPTTYNSWRHFYFLYPFMMVSVAVFFKFLLEKFIKFRWLIFTLVTLNSIIILAWMIKNHPYQLDYFTWPLRNQLIGNFEVSNLSISRLESIRALLNYDTGLIKACVVNDYNQIFASERILNPDLKARLQIPSYVSADIEKDFFQENCDYVIDELPWLTADKYGQNYQEIYVRMVDNYRVYTILKKN